MNIGFKVLNVIIFREDNEQQKLAFIWVQKLSVMWFLIFWYGISKLKTNFPKTFAKSVAKNLLKFMNFSNDNIAHFSYFHFSKYLKILVIV